MSLFVDIKKDFGAFRLDVSFENDGGVLGLLGASGCGKTMTLRCIAGIVKPDEGRIVLNGVTLFDSSKKINLPPQKRKVGYLFQSYGLFPNMTVEQNIMCGLKRENGTADKKKAVADMIDKMMLNGLENRRPAQLSGGQQQRTALARILVGKPDILLLDEPFSALDTSLRTRMQTEMKKMMGEFGKDTVLVTHNRNEAYMLCQRLAVMDSGRILNIDGVKEVFSDPGSIPAAGLTGCKNIASARKTGDHSVFIPEWNVTLETADRVREGIKAVGIRAHYFTPDESRNQHSVIFTEEIEEPFELILKFRYKGSDPVSEEIWWRLPKEEKPGILPESLGISPSDIMLLY